VTTPFRLWEWLAGWLSAGVRLAAQRACVVSKRTSARRKTIAKSKTQPPQQLDNSSAAMLLQAVLLRRLPSPL
jgi:hypothetical protein